MKNSLSVTGKSLGARCTWNTPVPLFIISFDEITCYLKIATHPITRAVRAISAVTIPAIAAHLLQLTGLNKYGLSYRYIFPCLVSLIPHTLPLVRNDHFTRPAFFRELAASAYLSYGISLGISVNPASSIRNTFFSVLDSFIRSILYSILFR